MADRGYYHLLEAGKQELTRLRVVGDALSGIHASDLTLAQTEAMAQIRAWNKVLVGPGQEAVFHAFWIDENQTYPTSVPPVRVRRVARLLGSALIWQQEEIFHGIASREERKGRRASGAVKKTASQRLLASAKATWDQITNDKTFIYPDGDIVDLATYTEEGGIGIASPEANFFADGMNDQSYGLDPVYSLEGAFRGLR